MLPAIRLTIISIILFSGVYSLIVWGFARIATPSKGNAATISNDGKTVGAELIGQAFTHDKYFQGRPSAVDYNGGGSAGSNKGPSNPNYLKTVQERIDTFLVHNPAVKKSDIPVELVTASGSGLDPDLSPIGAYVQVNRIANVRNLPEEKVKALIDQHVERPFLGFFGPEKVNVLKLNIALDKMSR